MATALYRLGRAAYRRWPVVLVTWLVLLLGVGGFAATQSKPFVESFTIDGIPSIAAADTQKELFPTAVSADKQVTGQVVVQAPKGHTLAEQPYKGQVDALVAALQKTPQLKAGQRLASPVVAGPAVEQQLLQAAQQQRTPVAVAKTNAKYVSPLSADKRTGIVSWTFDAENQHDVEKDTQQYVHDAVAKAQRNGLTVAAAGNGMTTFEVGHTSELIGIGFALVILVVTFGSLVAAGLPILTALVGVGLGSLLVAGATSIWDLNSNTPILATMIGLAVGIDYALFILSRYRSELTRTDDREHAVGIAIGTAGSAVVFAGLTVVIALTALFVSGISILGSMGAAAAVTVVLAVLLAITLLPAILGLLKGKAFAGRVRAEHEVSEADHDSVNGSVRLGRGIRKAPAIVTVLVTLALVLLAKPVTDLHLGLPSDATAAKGTQARIAADLVAEGWGPGKNAPMVAVVDNRDLAAAKRQAALGTVVSRLAKEEGVANAQVVQVTKDLSGAVVLVTPTTGPADEATDQLLERIRDDESSIEQASGAQVGVTGITAMNADISKKLSDALPGYLAIVVGLAFVILVLVFRSLVVPLVATAGFLLSVLATLGAAVRVVQHGDLGIFDPQPIMSLMPTLLIGIVFGLAMDYQVFLTTRMREAYVHGMDAKDAIIDGFRHSGRVVTAAALIMMSVFAAFAFQDNALIKSMGVSLALAIFFDAFVVRMVLVPAVMNLLGRHAWWMPRWLDRILPNVDVEGAGLERGDAEAAPEAATEAAPAPLAARTGATAPARPAATPVVEAVPAATVEMPAAVAEPVTAEAPRPGIHGVVTLASGAPLADARVTLADQTGKQATRTRTAEDGSYELVVENGGTYLLLVAADGVAPTASLVPVADGPVRRDVVLAGSAWLSGRVLRRGADPADVRPVADALLTLTDVSGQVVGSQRTTAEGAYVFERITAGPYVLTAQADGHRPVARSVDVVGADQNTFDVVLAAGGGLQGTVLAADDHTPVRAATVTLTDDGGQIAGSTVTGPDGTFRFTDLDAGGYVLTAAGYAPVAREVRVVDGHVGETAIELGTPAADDAGHRPEQW